MPCHIVFINYHSAVRKSLWKRGRAVICSVKYERSFPVKFACKHFQWTAHMHTQVLLMHNWELTEPGRKILQHQTQERNPDPMKQQKWKHLIHKESNKEVKSKTVSCLCRNRRVCFKLEKIQIRQLTSSDRFKQKQRKFHSLLGFGWFTSSTFNSCTLCY